MPAPVRSQVENGFIGGLAGAAVAAAVFLMDVVLRECAFGTATDVATALPGLVAAVTILLPGVALLSGLVTLLYGVPAGFLLRKVGLESGPAYLLAGAAGGWLVAAATGWDGVDFRLCFLADGCAAAWPYWRLLRQADPVAAAPPPPLAGPLRPP